MPKEKKKTSELHCWKPDPHGDKEPTKPLEKRKKPRISIAWAKLKRLLEIDD